MRDFRPVTRGADQDEEEDVDCECVKDGYDGAFRDGDTWSLQLPFRDTWRKSKHQGVRMIYSTLLCVLTAGFWSSVNFQLFNIILHDDKNIVHRMPQHDHLKQCYFVTQSSLQCDYTCNIMTTSFNLTCWLRPWFQCSWWTWRQTQWQKTWQSWCCNPESNQLERKKRNNRETFNRWPEIYIYKRRVFLLVNILSYPH